MPEAIPLNHLSSQVQSPESSHAPLPTQTLSISFSSTILPAQWSQLKSANQTFYLLEFKNKSFITPKCDKGFPLIPRQRSKYQKIQMKYKCALEFITSSLTCGMEGKGALFQKICIVSLFKKQRFRGPNSNIRMNTQIVQKTVNILKNLNPR